jgi:type I restriction enzyme R subunit
VDLEQTQNGNTQHFYLRFIDWEHQENNVFHVAANYTLAGLRNMVPITIDLMLFVNGIPFVVIECVAPQVSVQQAQANLLKCQNSNNSLNLFIFPHIMLALNGKEASYAAIGGRAPHWARWREEIPYEELRAVRTQAMPVAVKAALFDLVQMRMNAPISTSQERPPYHNHYEMNQQDQTLYALCRPARLLELVRNATVFDGNVRKLVRYHQFFAVQRAMQHVRQWKDAGQRQGGVIVQAEGSG